MFNELDYYTLSNIVFNEDNKYPGYRPSVIESPNGDGKWDTGKRYAHVAKKYVNNWNSTWIDKNFLYEQLSRGHKKAIEVAIALGVPREYWPDIEYSALRILEYPPGATSEEHTDFSLFTLMGYRNIPQCFEYVYTPKSEKNTNFFKKMFEEGQKLNHQLHFGELLELINPNFPANTHKVSVEVYGRTQYSIVYFAIPNHAAVLPNGQTVGAWIDERVSRSREYGDV